MKIAKYIHSFISVEDGKTKVLVDPGPFSFIEEAVRIESFEGVKAIFITHKHADHYDPVAIRKILDKNPKLKIFGNGETVDKLNDEGIKAEVFEEGGKEIGNLRIRAFFAKHEPLPGSTPKNTAFLFNNDFLHPGDSFDPVIFGYPAKMLALPVFAPWLTTNKALEFASEFKPRQVVPVHDGYVKDYFLERQYQNWEKWLGEKGIKFSSCMYAGDSCRI